MHDETNSFTARKMKDVGEANQGWGGARFTSAYLHHIPIVLHGGGEADDQGSVTRCVGMIEVYVGGSLVEQSGWRSGHDWLDSCSMMPGCISRPMI